MNISGKKIGIWGFGVVGKSLVNYLSTLDVHLIVIEKRTLNSAEIDFLNQKKITHLDQSHIDEFLETNDFIVASPGINLEPYEKYKHKWITELDIFSANFKKPVVSITGTVGKTTITHLIGEILKLKGINAIQAGNIGLGMCDLIEKQSEIDCVVLELSSFQLEHCISFAPDIAVWTNFYANHLDRHGTLQSYFDAKSKIFTNQLSNQKCLLPFTLAGQILRNSNSCNFFSLNKPTDLKFLQKNDSLFFMQNESIYKLQDDKLEFVFDVSKLPPITYLENWLIICAVLYLQNINISDVSNFNLQLPEHRLEKFAVKGNINFYNDSKSTIPDATIAAVTKLQEKPMMLFLGGLSKGVDRAPLIKDLKNYKNLKHIICFGKESESLKNICDLNEINSTSCATLEEAVELCFKIMHDNYQIVFSPAGSSFDLFLDYQDRGRKFKQIVNDKIKMG